MADVTGVLCELELTIKKVKVSTTPDGKVMDLFFVTDTRFAFAIFILKTHVICFANFMLVDAMSKKLLLL